MLEPSAKKLRFLLLREACEPHEILETIEPDP